MLSDKIFTPVFIAIVFLFVVPVPDSVVLRVLYLYMLVGSGGKTSCMRRKPYKLLLHAPPSQWVWGEELGQLCPFVLATPTSFKESHSKTGPCSIGPQCY